MLPHLVAAIRDLPGYRAFTATVPARGEERRVRSLAGSSGAVLLAALAQDDPQRVMLVVTDSPGHAEAWHADLEVLARGLALVYPQREALGEVEPHYEIAGERTETLDAVLSGRARVVVTTLRATIERTRVPAALMRARLTLGVEGRERPQDIVARLEAMGYTRAPSVTDVAQFAVRGGLLDIYGYGMASPARIEWWGDEIISVRSFDLDSQRSEGEIGGVTILPVGLAVLESDDGGSEPQSLLELLPPDTLLIVDKDVHGAEVEQIWDEAAHHLDVARRRGEDVPGRDALFLAPDAWRARWEAFGRVVWADEGQAHDFRITPPPAIGRDMKVLQRVVRAQPTLILCDNEGQLERLEEILAVGDAPGARVPPTVTLALGALRGGFALPELVVLTDHEVFRRARRIRRARRFRQALQTAASPLTAGDYVVHLEHGIGIYRGIERIEVGEGTMLEVAVIEYEGGDRLNVPLYRLDQVERYRAPDSGMDRPPPRLDRLGGTRWRRQREKTERAIRRMAAELVDLYARRAVTSGFAFPPDGP